MSQNIIISKAQRDNVKVQFFFQSLGNIMYRDAITFDQPIRADNVIYCDFNDATYLQSLPFSQICR